MKTSDIAGAWHKILNRERPSLGAISTFPPPRRGVERTLGKRFAGAAVLCGLFGISAVAQTFDTSGTGTVAGDYFVRQVAVANLDQTTSEVGRAFSLTGIMTFDGAGSYSFSGQLMDTDVGAAQAFNTTGAYAVSSSGLVQIQNPIDDTDYEFGGVGAIGPAAIVASSTEGPYDDIFIAIPAGSGVSNGSLQGTYVAGFIDYLQGFASQVRDGYFTLATNGNGNFGNVTVAGAMANQGSVDTTQKIFGVTYDIFTSDGSGTINFPAPAAELASLVSGQKTLYVSADGNILLGGSPSGFDVIIAIRANSRAANDGMYRGTYFTAALENNATDLANGVNGIDSYYGSIFSLGQGTTIQHERLVFFDVAASDSTFEGTPYHFDSNGRFNDGLLQSLLAADGQAILQVGTGSFYSLQPGFQATEYSSTGVFLDPLKVWNAATFAPITNPVAPGEFVSLFGTGLASGTAGAVSLPLSTSLGGVQVTVNGRLARLHYVSQNQINILVPYATSEPYATFQVFNHGVASNPVTIYTNLTAPGVFAATLNGEFAPGVGPAAVLHANFSAVTQDNPASEDEVLQLYLTGLGSVTPPVGDGAAGPAVPSIVDTGVAVFVDGIQADIQFQGLAPGFAGLYQVNFVVPRGVSAGSLVYVDVQTSDASTSQAKIFIQ